MEFRNTDDVRICMLYNSDSISENTCTEQRPIHIHKLIRLHLLHSRCDESDSVDDDIRQGKDCGAKQAISKSKHDHLLVRASCSVHSVLCVLSGDDGEIDENDKSEGLQPLGLPVN